MFTSTVLFGLALFACTYGEAVDTSLVEDLTANITASIKKDLESAGEAELGSRNTLQKMVKNVTPQLEHLARLTSPQEAADIVLQHFKNSTDSNGLTTRMGLNRRRHLAVLMRNAVMGAQRFRS